VAPALERCQAACQVADLMTPKPVVVSPDTLVRDVLATMTERRFRHMPVVDPQGRLVGLVSQHYLVRAHNPGESLSELDAPISELMLRNVDTVTAERCAAEAARHMLRTKRSCLPVVDAERKVIGILTEADYLRLATRGAPACSCGGVNEANHSWVA
jgi:CBS domain-containing protein